jgi:hypothetical protein
VTVAAAEADATALQCAVQADLRRRITPRPALAFKLLKQTTDAEMKPQLVRMIAAAYGLPNQPGHTIVGSL